MRATFSHFLTEDKYANPEVGDYKMLREINVAGFHMHFISDDRTFGGHAIEFEGKDLVDQMTEYTFVLPGSGSFDCVRR